jgi:hypothetical protein
MEAPSFRAKIKMHAIVLKLQERHHEIAAVWTLGPPFQRKSVGLTAKTIHKPLFRRAKYSQSQSRFPMSHVSHCTAGKRLNKRRQTWAISAQNQ